jgi:flagellar biosynthesis protein FliQ
LVLDCWFIGEKPYLEKSRKVWEIEESLEKSGFRPLQIFPDFSYLLWTFVMSDALVMTLIQRALETLLAVIGPMLAVAVTVGVGVSLVQTLTSIQDQTFSFAPRVAAIFGVFLLTFPWILEVLVTFTNALFGDFTMYIK